MMAALLISGSLGLAGVLVAGLAFATRERCPSCQRKLLAITGGKKGTGVDAAGARIPFSETDYVCRGCSGTFRQLDRRGIVSIEAWERGMREPPPTMTVR